MSLKICPICEVNYIKEEDNYCNICRRNIKSGMRNQEEQSLCAECGEALPLNSQELCAYCQSELKRREKLEKLMEKPALIKLDVEQLDEIEVEMPADIPSDDLNDMNDEFGNDDEEDEADEEDDVNEL